MCIGSNWVNEAQDLMYVTKFCNLPNKQDPSVYLHKVTCALQYIVNDGCCWSHQHEYSLSQSLCN